MRASIKASIVAAAEKLGDTVPFWWFECCGARHSLPLYVDRGTCPKCREVTRRRELTAEELVMIASLAPEAPEGSEHAD